tara:strand:+ start:1831 stop:2916 length:1086 start_codon:yes stop_codon:yes gene_type:complete
MSKATTPTKVSDKLSTKKVNTVLKGLTTYVVDAMNQAIEDIQIPPIQVPVFKDNQHIITLDGHVNNQLSKIVAVSQLGIPVCLFGGSGTGKTTIAKQLSQALDLPFYCQTVTAGMPESMLLGRHMLDKDKGMTYIQTPFLNAVENGGVFLLDEFDAIDENCALAINNLLEFGYLNLPMRTDKPVVEAHPDFRFIACANTKLNGASLIHNGRNQLDGATISRFDGGIFEIGYDLALERLLCPRAHIRVLFQEVRRIVLKHNIRKEISTRTLKRAEMLWRTGLFRTPTQLLEHFMINWSEQESSLIKEEIGEDIKKLADVEALTAEEQETLEGMEEDADSGDRAEAKKFLDSMKESEVTELDA